MVDRSFARVNAEMIVRVSDAEGVKRAAIDAIRLREYGDAFEREADLAADGDLLRAVLDAVDVETIADGVAGLDVLSSSVGVRQCDGEGRVSLQLPDFRPLFRVCACGQPGCQLCGGWQLTPRTAAAMWLMAEREGDAAYDDIEVHGDDAAGKGDWQVFDQYPRTTWGQDAVWRRQAARAFDDLARDLAAGEEPTPRCPAEEMALLVILDAASAAVNDEWDHYGELMAELPKQPDDFDWRAAGESLYQDNDLSGLFDLSLDGVDDPDDEHNRFIGMGDYRPSAWFSWFGGSAPRDPRRRFRR
jgi:hypothetical protein